MESVDAVVVGAGVVGLAVGRALGKEGLSVVIVERHEHCGTETSSRNSGVIHSGIYYPTGSMKATTCVRGRDLLYEYCTARGVPHRRCGKLVVAQEPELPKLDALVETARRNGVEDLEWLDGAGVSRIEAEVRAAAGLWCPSTGIVSVHEFMTSLHGDVEDSGGILAFRTEMISAQPSSSGFRVELQCDGESISLNCSRLVNAAGLSAVSLLERIDGYESQRAPAGFFAKGSYFDYAGRSPFTHLVYPMPSEAGLGVHATLDVGGQLRFGPDVEWLDGGGGNFDYAVGDERGRKFYAAIREYWPSLPDGSLRPSYSGIRPKLVGPGSPPADFHVEGPLDHRVPGLVNMLGIESPGLTASLALGEAVVDLLA